MASQERFGYEWSKWTEIDHEDEIQFLKWVYPLKKEDFRDKFVLDAACGKGKNAVWPLKYGAKKLVAFDYDSRTVKAARNNLKKYKNAIVEFKSIYDISYKSQFDVVFCIGVVHHLEDPHKAVKKLVEAAKPSGIVVIWVYGYEGNEWIVSYINPLRKNVTSKLPLPLVDFITYFFSIPLFIFLRIFPQQHPYLKQLSSFRFRHVHQIVFDQLIPKIANYWKKNEALELFRDKGLKDIRIYRVNKNSWTVTGKKK